MKHFIYDGHKIGEHSYPFQYSMTGTYGYSHSFPTCFFSTSRLEQIFVTSYSSSYFSYKTSSTKGGADCSSFY